MGKDKSEKKEEEKEPEVKFVSQTIRCEKMSLDDINKLHEHFRPLAATSTLNMILDEVAANKKSKDDAQKERLNAALGLIDSGICLPTFPIKTREKLVKGMKKQLK